MLLVHLFFDFALSTCPKKMETEKWPKAADSLLYYIKFSFLKKFQKRPYFKSAVASECTLKSYVEVQFLKKVSKINLSETIKKLKI